MRPTVFLKSAFTLVLLVCGIAPYESRSAHAQTPPAESGAGDTADTNVAPTSSHDRGKLLPGTPGGKVAETLPHLFERQLPFDIGERLEYLGQIKVGGWVEAGTATFAVTEERPGLLVFTSRAQGSKLGYSLETTIESKVYRGAAQPLLYSYRQRGSEHRDKKLQYYPGGAVYLKVKHCRTEGCTHADHRVKNIDWVGPIPWGRKEEHCDDTRCGNLEHRVWRERGRHELTSPGFDLLTAVYYARTLDFGEVGSSSVIPVVNDRDRWNVRIRVLKRGKIKVKAGEFTGLQVILEPEAASEDASEEFEGLFGLNGSIEIWMDAETRRPLKIAGEIPFAFTNLSCKIELTEIGTVPEKANK